MNQSYCKNFSLMVDITLIKLNHKSHVSQDAIIDFEDEIIRGFHCEIKNEMPSVMVKILGKIYFKFPKQFNYLTNLLSKIKVDKNIFAVVMGSVYTKYPLYAFTCKHKILFLFDAWEPDFAQIEYIIVNLKIDIVFFTYRQSFEHFRKTLPQVKCFWIPEGILSDGYYAMPYSQKDIDILHLG